MTGYQGYMIIAMLFIIAGILTDDNRAFKAFLFGSILNFASAFFELVKEFLK
jgi:hypothetical protein